MLHRRGWVRRVDGADRRRDAPHRGGDPDGRRLDSVQDTSMTCPRHVHRRSRRSAGSSWLAARTRASSRSVRSRARASIATASPIALRRLAAGSSRRCKTRPRSTSPSRCRPQRTRRGSSTSCGRLSPRLAPSPAPSPQQPNRRLARGPRLVHFSPAGAIGAGKVQGRLGGPVWHGLQPSDEFHRGDGEGVPRHNDRLSRVAQVRRRRRCDFNSVRGVMEGGRTYFART